MSATARLVELLDAEVQTLQVRGDGYVVALIVPGVHPTADQAELAADEVHAAIERALSSDLGPLHVQAERITPAAPATPEETR